MKKILKKIIDNKNIVLLIIFMTVLMCVKQYLIYDFPIMAYYGLGEDDALMIKFTESMLNKEWLGPYQYNTLLKGPIFPKILSITYKLGFSYIFSMTFLYSISCLVFILAIRKKVKNKWMLGAIFAILIFNPIMLTKDIIQRVYRNSLIPSFALLIISSFIGMYIRRDDRLIYIMFWSLIGSVSLSVFYYTREDSLWILPFVIFMTICFLISLILKEKKITAKLIIKIFCIIMPAIFTILLGTYIANKNEYFYGVNTTNVLTNSSLTEAIKAMYSVKFDDDVEMVSITKKKIYKMSEYSPTLSSLTEEIIKYINGYGLLDTNPGDGEVSDGWFFWVITSAVQSFDYNAATQQQDVYQRIADELNKAMDEGLLERRYVFSAQISPWKKGNLSKSIKNTCKSISFISSFSNMSITIDEKLDFVPGAYESIKKFTEYTHDETIYPENAVNMDGEKISELESQEEYLGALENRYKIINILFKIYKYIGIMLGIIGIIEYIQLMIYMIAEKDNENKKSYIENWIIASGILGAITTLIIGISYSNIYAGNTISCLYLAGAYPLYIGFTCYCICINKFRFIRKLTERVIK